TNGQPYPSRSAIGPRPIVMRDARHCSFAKSITNGGSPMSSSSSNKPDAAIDDDVLTEHCLSSRELPQTHFMKVRQDRVLLPSGREGEREYVVHPGAVLVIPLLDDGQLVLERQYRYPLRRVFIELPAGKIDPNEDP